MKKVVMIGLMSSLLLLTACGKKNVDVNVDIAKTTALADCLSENDRRMYGTATCPHCKDQKALFWSAFSDVEYIDCQLESQKCTIAGITWVPVWRWPNSAELRGTQPLNTLATTAGCEWTE